VQELFNTTDTAALIGLEHTLLVWTGDTNGWMINGKTISNYGIFNPNSKALEVTSVEPDKDYKLRFCRYTQLYLIDVLQLGAGQGFSTFLQTKTCEELKELGMLDYYIQIKSRDRLMWSLAMQFFAITAVAA
jgi:L-ascorbate oxidase